MSQSHQSMPGTSSISLSDLAAAEVLLTHAEAVAIAREIGLQVARGALPGVPLPEDIRFRDDGDLELTRPPTPGSEIRRTARLLATMLAQSQPELGAPATFRIVFARAFATDEAAYETLEQFMTALTPFGVPDVNAAVRDVVARWQDATAATASLEDFESETVSEPTVPVQPTAATESLPSPPAVPSLPAAATVRPPRPSIDKRASRRWIPALAAVALLVALLPALWFMRSRGAPPARQSTPEVSAPKQDAATADKDLIPAPNESSGTTGEHRAAGPDVTETATKPATRPEARALMRPPREVIRDSAFSPAFAAKESGMFFHTGTGPGSAIMRAETADDGGVLKVISVVDDRGTNFHPRPSPDGQRLAFDSDRDGERGVYLANADGKDVRRISGPGFAAVPSWSPDGRRLAFVRAEDRRPRVWNIWTVDVDTGSIARVTSHPVGQPWGAAWFPDGNRIAYSHEDRLILRTLEGKDERIFKSPVPGRLVRTPAVSPDGKRIIFQVRRDGAWMLDVPSGSMFRVLEDPSAEEFTWSPDGRRVAYHSRRSGTWGVWIMAPR